MRKNLQEARQMAGMTQKQMDFNVHLKKHENEIMQHKNNFPIILVLTCAHTSDMKPEQSNRH